MGDIKEYRLWLIWRLCCMPGVPWARNFETYPGRAMDIHFGSFPLTGTVHLLGNPHGALRKVGGAKFMI